LVLFQFPDLTGAYAPAVTLGRGLPRNRDGQPCKYYWKEMLKLGRVVTIKGEVQQVTEKRLETIERDYRRAQAKGYEAYLPVGSHYEGKKNNGGYLVDVERRGNSLYGLHQFIGPEIETEKLVARQKSSIGTIANVKDIDGDIYEELIDHNAILPDPQYNDLKGFEPANIEDFQPALAASRGQPIEAVVLTNDREHLQGAPIMGQELTSEHVGKIKKMISDSDGDDAAKDISTENGIDRLIGHAAKKGMKMSREDLDAARQLTGMENLSADEAVAALLRKAKESGDKVLQLSRDVKTADDGRKAAEAQSLELGRNSRSPSPPTPAELHYASRAIASERDKAIRSGAITPAIADQAEAKFLKKPVEFKSLTLSREIEPTDGTLRTGLANLLDFYEAVQGNTPSPTLGGDPSVAAANMLALGRNTLPGQGGPGGGSAIEKTTEDRWAKEDDAMQKRELAYASAK